MASATADELLKWGIANSSSDAQQSIAQLGEDIQSGKRSDLADPGLYKKIMGQSEADQMKEQLTVAANSDNQVEDRATALDNFEMLVESIDNANLMENMQMWPVFLKLLSDPSSEIQVGAAWIVGTAVQNNDKAQVVVLRHGFLPALLNLLEQSPSSAVRSKVAYALSGLLKNNPAAINALDESSSSTESGWATLARALQDPSIQLRRKITFLVYNLLLQDVESHEDEPPPTTASPAAAAPATAAAVGSHPTSASTAITLAPQHATHEPAAVDSSAPLEKGPATAGVPYPDVPARLAKAAVVQVLASSLLPRGGGDSGLPDGAYQPVTDVGPDADQEPRLDVDYAEKAVRTLVLFTQNVAQRKSQSMRETIGTTLFTKPLLLSVLNVLGQPAPGDSEPWHQTLGIELEEWTAFRQNVRAM